MSTNCKIYLHKLMKMNLRTVFVLFFLLTNFSLFSQKPEYVLPGQSKLLEPTNDTLWVLNNKQFKQTIIAKEQLKICNKQVDIYKNMTDSLKAINVVYDEKVKILEQDRDFYIKNWKEAENDVKLLADLNKRQSAMTQIAIVAGITATIIAFFGGFLLAK